jgi:multicomponent Na+:H+ antiporter subunit D
MGLPPLAVGIPLAAAAVLIALTWIARRWFVDSLAFLTAVAVAVICGLLLRRAIDGPFVYWFGGWEPVRGVALGISFTVDTTGAGLAALVAVLVTAALAFSWRYLDVTGSFFHVLVLVFLAATTGFSLSGDLFNMFVFFELMSVSAYALTGYRIEEGRPLHGAINFAVTNSLGAILVLIGIALLYGRTGALNLAQIGAALSGQPVDGLVVVAFVFVTSGFFVKAAMVPFHFWLADAHAVAPSAVCVLFSGVMVQLGLYAAARLYWTVFAGAIGEGAGDVRTVLLWAGVLTAVVGAVLCFEQLHLKRLLAFSTVSHMGLFLIGFSLLDPHALAGLYVYVLAHGALKAALFMGVGVLLHRFRSAHEIQLRGKGRAVRYVGLLFALGGLLLAGLPPFGPWFGKAVIDEASSPLGLHWITAVYVIASAVTGAAVLRAAGRVFIGWSPPDELAEVEFPWDVEEQGHTETTGDHGVVPWTMVAPMTLLVVLGASAGLWGGVLDRAGAGADFFVDGESYARLVLDDREPGPPAPPPHAPALQSYAIGVLSAAGAVAGAWAALFRHRFPTGMRKCLFGLFDPPIDRLRALHSGQVGDYVAWLTVGVATLGALFGLLL